MSNSVDNRIVQMKFDNKQFERDIKTSTDSLDRLKKGLDMEGAVKGLGESVEVIKGKFTALGIVGVTALVNITNSVVNAGKNMISALTIDPVKMGFNEYETKMGSIQTILTNTAHAGTTLEQVNKKLNELNEYSDQTIYNFAEMTRNIGTFTAAGIDLETSVTAIKGIANLAAGSGSNAQQASTAMYQLSQALAAGKVSLQDWNSVVNAGMGGKLFQNALEKTAKKLGKGRDMSVSFRESLQDGWITTKVLTETLKQFAADESLIKAATQVKTFTQLFDTMKESVQSGWAQTWELIIGDKNEATTMLTAINDVFGSIAGSSADARNNMLSFWKENGGREAMLQGLVNVFKGLQAILKPIGEAFREIFPKATGQGLLDFSKGFRDLTEKFKIGAETVSNIKLSFKGLFAVLDIGLKAVQLAAKLFVGGIGLLIKALTPASGLLLEVTAKVGSFLVSLNDAIDLNHIAAVSFEALKEAFTALKSGVAKVIEYLTPALTTAKKVIMDLIIAFKEMFTGTTAFAATLNEATEPIQTATTETSKFRDVLEGIGKVLSWVKGAISDVANEVSKVLGPVFRFIAKNIEQMSFKDLGAVLTGGGLLLFARTIVKAMKSVDDILDNFSNVIGQVGKSLKAFQLQVKAKALLTVAIALAVLTAAIIALSYVDIEDLAKGLGILTVAFAELIIVSKMLNKNMGSIGLFQKQTKLQLVGLGVSILLLAFAVKTLASIDPDRLTDSVVAIGALMGGVVAFVKMTKGADLKASSAGLIAFGLGIMTLVTALRILGNMDPGTLIQGGVAIASLMAAIAVFIKFTNGADLKTSAGSLRAFALGMTILVGALAILGNMDQGKLIQGGVALVALMTVVANFINLTNGSDLAKSAGGLTGFAVGITILVGALAILGNMNAGNLIQGGAAIVVLMSAVASFINLTNGSDLQKSASGLTGFAIGITILVGALAVLANLNTGGVIQGTAAIAGLMVAVAMFTDITNGGDLQKSSTGIIGFAAGLTVLSLAVAILASINPDRITQGVVSIVTLMVAIGAFVALTKEGDLAKSGKGLLGFSAGLMVLAGVIAILSAIDPERLLSSSVALSALITAVAMFVKTINGAKMLKTSTALIAFSVGVGALALSIGYLAQFDYKQLLSAGGAITVLLLAIVGFVKLTNGADVIVSAAALVVFSGAILVMASALAVLGSIDAMSLVVGIGAIAAVLVVLGVASLVLTPLTPVIIALSAALVLFGAGCLAVGGGMLLFAQGIDIMAKSGKAGAEVLIIAVEGILRLIPLALAKFAEGIIEFARVFGDGVPTMREAFMKVVNAILITAVEVIPRMVEAGMRMVLGILSGVAANIQQVVQKGIEVILGFILGVASKIPDIIDTAFKVIISFINGLADAIRNNHQAIFTACRNLINAIIEAITSMTSNLVGVGSDLVRGLINGIVSMGKALRDALGGIVNSAVDGVKKLLGIHSPSRVFAEIGKYSVEGFAVGLDKYSDLASKAAGKVGINAMDSLGNAISSMSDIVNGNIDTNPTIRPVMDLSNIQNGSRQISGMMNKYNGYSVSGTVDMADNAASSMNHAKNVATSSKVETKPTAIPQRPNQQNIFNIHSTDPKGVADEVALILQKQVEREDEVWA